MASVAAARASEHRDEQNDKIDRLIAEAKQMVDNIIEWVRILLYA